MYLFADYSGAQKASAQRRAIRLAQASRRESPKLVEKRLTREELVTELVSRLTEASRVGMRACIGQDHQYSIPYKLAQELSISHLSWRDALRSLCSGSYGQDAPALGHPRTFAASFNAWLVARGLPAYFYSATKGALYGIPSQDPRRGGDSRYRLTERFPSRSGKGSPKPLNRVGDNGSVGGQSLLGMAALVDLLHRCECEGVRLAVWPFDGLSITGSMYADAHVMIEPYPSAVRPTNVVQTDDSDALASTGHTRDMDAADQLAEQLDLSGVDDATAAVVRFEGWIVSHQP
ncbi:MAG: hypothetical protein Q8R28_18285 [Dehalococcoidia bacterium]|nr:hypothetical protein [Dehalococcoidia bacterium]